MSGQIHVLAVLTTRKEDPVYIKLIVRTITFSSFEALAVADRVIRNYADKRKTTAL